MHKRERGMVGCVLYLYWVRCEPKFDEYGRRAAKEAAMDVDDEGWFTVTIPYGIEVTSCAKNVVFQTCVNSKQRYSQCCVNSKQRTTAGH